jgi:hypothetical protein
MSILRMLGFSMFFLKPYTRSPDTISENRRFYHLPVIKQVGKIVFTVPYLLIKSSCRSPTPLESILRR